MTFSFPSVQAAELLVSKLLKSFEAEGFFVHTLSHDDRLYQLRQNAVVIGFSQRGTDIVFECGPGDVPFLARERYINLVPFIALMIAPDSACPLDTTRPASQASACWCAPT